MRARGQSIAEKDGWEASRVDFAKRHCNEDLDWIYYYDVEQRLNKFFEQDQIAENGTKVREESTVTSICENLSGDIAEDGSYVVFSDWNSLTQLTPAATEQVRDMF